MRTFHVTTEDHMRELWFPEDADVIDAARKLNDCPFRFCTAGYGIESRIFRLMGCVDERWAFVHSFLFHRAHDIERFVGTSPANELISGNMSRRFASAALAWTHELLGYLQSLPGNDGFVLPIDNLPLWGVGITARQNYEARHVEDTNDEPCIFITAKSNDAIYSAAVRFAMPWPSVAMQQRLFGLLTLNMLLCIAGIPQIPLDIGYLEFDDSPPAPPGSTTVHSDDLVEHPINSHRYVLEPLYSTAST